MNTGGITEGKQSLTTQNAVATSLQALRITTMSRAEQIINRLEESNMPFGWGDTLGSRGLILDVSGKDIPQAIRSLAEMTFGRARESRSTPSTYGQAKPNKAMYLEYGFDNSTLSNFLRLNGKNYDHEKFIKIIIEKGVQVTKDSFVIKWGSQAVIAYIPFMGALYYYKSHSQFLKGYPDNEVERVAKKLKKVNNT